ncbi:MAG: DUF3122 domain-containing protein [Microcoleaceae cyanobacterium MO_207.B10]|nr:DUF3122 domain-containing protein [Microcoleaceae cyanobacterium MO_207.B10]
MIRKVLSKFLLLSGLILLTLIYQGSFNLNQANALIREIEEAPNQIVYQAKHTLKDQTNQSWQVVFYKRVKSGKVDSINLRLVGFPGSVEFVHPQPLKISVHLDKVLMAADNFAEKSPASNVGEYNLKKVLPELKKNASVLIFLPLTDNHQVKIKIPLPVLLEWQDVMSRN